MQFITLVMCSSNIYMFDIFMKTLKNIFMCIYIPVYRKMYFSQRWQANKFYTMNEPTLLSLWHYKNSLLCKYSFVLLTTITIILSNLAISSLDIKEWIVLHFRQMWFSNWAIFVTMLAVSMIIMKWLIRKET